MHVYSLQIAPDMLFFSCVKKNSSGAGSPATNVNLDTETAISATDTNDTVGTAIPAVFFCVSVFSSRYSGFPYGVQAAGEAASPGQVPVRLPGRCTVWMDMNGRSGYSLAPPS